MTAAKPFLSQVIDAALTAMYAYRREHFRSPERFRLSSEADAAVREELKRQVASCGSKEDIEKLAAHPNEPLSLYGVNVEVGDDLTGAEVEAV
jgi:hypothetical protein